MNLLAALSPSALLTLLLAGCGTTQTPSEPDAALVDSGTPKKDAGFLDLDAGPGPDAAYAVPSVFRGEWDPLPGLEAYPVWTARNPAVSATALHWKPCTPATAGCEELDVDWSSAPFGTRLRFYSNDSTPFYREGGRSYFIYQRVFPPPGGGVAYVGEQTVVEEMGVGVRFVLGEAPPFNSNTVTTFGGGTVGLSSLPRVARNAYEHAFHLDQKTMERATWDLAPLAIPQDDLGIPVNYGTHFSHWSGATVLTVLTDVRTQSLLKVPDSSYWSSELPRADGLFAANESINRIDFIDWTGKVTAAHSPPSGWTLGKLTLDRDSNTLAWFEIKDDNRGRANLFVARANAVGFAPRLVHAVDFGDPNVNPGDPTINGDLIAYAFNRKLSEVVRISTGETRRVTVPDPYQGASPLYVDENALWEPHVAGLGVTTMFRLDWKNAPIVP